MPQHDPRLDLETLHDQNLFDIARNSEAVHRGLAVRMLVERASPFASRDEILTEARRVVLDDPMTIKGLAPEVAAKLPDLLDLVADAHRKHVALAQTVGDNQVSHTRALAMLEQSVSDNQAAHDRALAHHAVTLTQSLTEQHELRTNLDEHQKELVAMKHRLALLERSPWQKLKGLVGHHS